MSERAGTPLVAGEVMTVDVGSVAHGGVCVARHDGRVIFVRHALPGERVRVRVTDAPDHGRFARAEMVEVLLASPHRVPPPCPYAAACGGCDWQHVDLAEQRRLKAAVVAEQFRRLAKIDVDPVVEGVPGDHDGLGWRTRMRFAVDAEGCAGLHGHRSHDVVPLTDCLIAHDAIRATDVLAQAWPGAAEVLAVAPSVGEPVVLPDPRPRDAQVIEQAAGRTWRLDATAFWQVHPGAATALVGAVRSALEPRPGDHVVDLYAGAGLFAGALADALGPGGRVDAVEADEVAIRSARRSLHDAPTIHLHHMRVDTWLTASGLRRCDLVVLDPPRSGAGAAVLKRLVRLRPRAIAYVACDPAGLARDVSILAELGWHLQGLRAFDLFPMTHHVECVAHLRPATVTP